MSETNDQHNRRSYDTEVAVLKARFTDFVEGTEKYRIASCAKQDTIIKTQNEIISRLDKLPCDARKPMWQWVERNIYALWCFIGGIVLTIVSEWIKKK